MARKNKEEPPRPTIVVLYTSLMILLLAFFIMLNSISKVEEAKVEAAYASLLSTFGFTPGGLSPLRSRLRKAASRLSPPITRLQQDYLSLKGLVKEHHLEKQVTMLRSKGIRTISISALVLFAPNSVEISPGGRAFLGEVAKVLASGSYPLSLYGHTDNGEPPAGSDNWQLSGERAVAVARVLEAGGVARRRLAAFGFAHYKPMYSNRDPQRRLRNNRVDLILDARDLSRHQLPAGGPRRQINFRGFIFDLFGEKK